MRMFLGAKAEGSESLYKIKTANISHLSVCGFCFCKRTTRAIYLTSFLLRFNILIM